MMLVQYAITLALCLGTWVRGDDEPSFQLKGRFIQVTDLHPDNHYLDGSLARLACHRMESDDDSTTTKSPKQKYNSADVPEREPYTPFGADFDENDNRTAGHFGVPDGPCDSPLSLVNATFDYIEKVWKDKIDFIVWTGDNARHDNDNHFPRSPSHIFESNRLMRDKFFKIFKREDPLYPLTIPIVPCYGNNDVWPHNIFAPGPNYQTRSYASLWSDMIPEYERHTFERGGYFAVEIIPNKLAVISLNTLYWFGSNAAVDGCDRKSDPGGQQFEWLRVQLTEYRKRGVKAYLTGHVPPGKKFYYPSCDRRYTIWSHAFRDVILGHLYGHHNMDYFFLLDAKQALEEEEEAQMLKYLLHNYEQPDFSTFTDSELDILQRLSIRSPAELLDLPDTEFRTLGTEEYLTGLKERFQSIPPRPKPKGNSDKNRKKWEEKVREYEENYQVVQVSPSIIPAYFPAIRVIEYNISGLEGQKFQRDENEMIERTNWTEWWAQLDREIAEDQKSEYGDAIDESDGLTFQQSGPNSNRFFGDPSVLDSYRRIFKKPKKPPPSPRLPPEPHKSAPRGPIYEPQVLTPLRWEVHFINLTLINTLYEKDPERQWNYGEDFFRMEYSSDAAPYYMKDLTVGTWLDLGISIGKEKAVNMSEIQDGWSVVTPQSELHSLEDLPVSNGDYDDEIVKKKPKNGKGKKGNDKVREDQETYWDVYLRRAVINSGHKLDFSDDTE